MINVFRTTAIVVLMALSATVFAQTNGVSGKEMNPYVCLTVKVNIPEGTYATRIDGTITWCRDGVPITDYMVNPTQTKQIQCWEGANYFDPFCCAYRGITNEVRYNIRVINEWDGNELVLNSCGTFSFNESLSDLFLEIDSWSCFDVSEPPKEHWPGPGPH